MKHTTKLLTLAALACWGMSAASPVIAYSISNVTTAADWTGGSAANHWANSCGGAAGSSGASGGTAVAWTGHAAVTLPAGVPGAAGLGDNIQVCPGIIVHVPSGVGIDVNKGTAYPDTGTGVVVQGDAANPLGTRFIVDDGGLLQVNGTGDSANYNFFQSNQYGVFAVMPGGRLYFNNVTVGSQTQGVIQGALYIGCGDQTVYPVVTCAENAGAWVTASVASTLNITAVSTLPSALAVGDLVELSPVQQPFGTYPYRRIDGVTPPPSPPVMPKTNDTGAGHTCGTLSTCYIPSDTLLCVKQKSGNSITLGWPTLGNSWESACSSNATSEVAIAITNAGSGAIWLKKPAIVWATPAKYTWNNAKSFAVPQGEGQIDFIRRAVVVGAQTPSNAAGTGPGRPGDSSVAFPTFTVPAGLTLAGCTALRMEDVTAGGCNFDYNRAVLTYGGVSTLFTASGNVTYTGRSTAYCFEDGGVLVPTGSRSYNEMLIENGDFQGFVCDPGNRSRGSFFSLSTLDNSSNRRMAFRFNTSRQSTGLIQLSDFTASVTSPVEVNYNSFSTSPPPSAQVSGHINMFTRIGGTGPQYWDVSNNFAWTTIPFIGCGVSQGHTYFAYFRNGTITNNNVITDHLVAGDGSRSCQWQGTLIQDNRITGTGTGGLTTGTSYPGMPVGIMHNDFGDTAPNLFRYNLAYGTWRAWTMSSNSTWMHNVIAPGNHHVTLIDDFDSDAIAGYVKNITFAFNLNLCGAGPALECIDMGYLNQLWVDNIKIYNNTFINLDTNSNGAVMYGDPDPGASQLYTGVDIHSNAFANPNGGSSMSKVASGNATDAHMQQISLRTAGYNSNQTGNLTYVGVIPSGNQNSIPNSQYNRNIIPMQGGSLYNVSATRSISGITLQNASTATSSGVIIRLVVNSTSDMTLQRCDGTISTCGTAVQLNWKTAGQTYTIGSVTDPNTPHQYTQLSVTPGTPFNQVNNLVNILTTSPTARMAKMLTGSNAGNAYSTWTQWGQPSTAATATLYFTPRPTTLLAVSDTFAIFNTEVRLFASNGTDYVDAGVDIRYLPITSQTDSGISWSNTDYCPTCTNAPVVSGLPTTYTSGSNNSPFMSFTFPSLGGSAEGALCNGDSRCGGTHGYQPSGTGAWTAGGIYGGYLGAIPPPNGYPVPTALLP